MAGSTNNSFKTVQTRENAVLSAADFWQFLDSTITNEDAKYCQKWQKSDLSSV